MTGLLKEMLSETGDFSCGRVMSMISLIVGILVAFIGLYRGSDLSSLSMLSGVFVGAAFGGHAAAKFAERGPS